MAKSYIEVVRDDLSGETIPDGEAETIEFSVGGKAYTIDLGKKNAADFYKTLEKYTAVATRATSASRPKSATPARGNKNELAQMRAWAAENGYKVNARGRISSEVQEAYRAAN